MGSLRSDRLGEKRVMSNGLEAEIIEYTSSKNMVVRFTANGCIREGVTYQNFCLGEIACDGVNTYADRFSMACRERLGEENVMNNGLRATLIGYNGIRDCTVKFENGIVVKGVRYDNFKGGRVACPGVKTSLGRRSLEEQRIGMERVMNCGYIAKIVGYNGSNDMTVYFPVTDSIVEHVRFDNFMKGKVAPNVDYRETRRGLYF